MPHTLRRWHAPASEGSSARVQPRLGAVERPAHGADDRIEVERLAPDLDAVGPTWSSNARLIIITT